MTNYDYSNGTIQFSAYDLVRSHSKVVRYALRLAQHRLIGALLDGGVSDAAAEAALEWWHTARLLGQAGKLPRDASPAARACFEGAEWAVPMFEVSIIRSWVAGGAQAVLEAARAEWVALCEQIEEGVWDRDEVGLGVPFDRVARLAFTCWFAVSLRDVEDVEGMAK